MSCECGAAGPSVRKPKNVYWVDTFLVDLPRNFILMDPETIFISRVLNLSILREKIRCEIKILGDSNLEVSCVRYPSQIFPPDAGYKLRFYFTMVGIDEATKSADMLFNENRASVLYSQDHFHRKYSEGYISYIWQLKIVVRMLEYENLQNEWREKHQEWFQELMSRVCESDEKKQDLAFLLKRPSLSDVFTGRNDVMFVVVKSAYISKTKKYSRELVEYLEARSIKDASIPKLDFSKILNWILRGKDGPIEPRDVIVAFKQSCRLGLNYLQIISSAYIIELLRGNPDLDFVVDVIVAADLLEDPLLFSNALIRFLPNFLAIMSSEKWKKVGEISGSLSRSIIHGLQVRLNSGDKIAYGVTTIGTLGFLRYFFMDYRMTNMNHEYQELYRNIEILFLELENKRKIQENLTTDLNRHRELLASYIHDSDLLEDEIIATEQRENVERNLKMCLSRNFTKAENRSSNQGEVEDQITKDTEKKVDESVLEKHFDEKITEYFDRDALNKSDETFLQHYTERAPERDYESKKLLVPKVLLYMPIENMTGSDVRDVSEDQGVVEVTDQNVLEDENGPTLKDENALCITEKVFDEKLPFIDDFIRSFENLSLYFDPRLAESSDQNESIYFDTNLAQSPHLKLRESLDENDMKLESENKQKSKSETELKPEDENGTTLKNENGLTVNLHKNNLEDRDQCDKEVADCIKSVDEFLINNSLAMEANNYWADCVVIDLPPDFVLQTNIHWTSLPFFVGPINETLKLELCKSNDRYIAISCFRYHSDNLSFGDKYLIRMYFTVIGINEATKISDLSKNINRGTVIYLKESFENKYKEGYVSFSWQIKITFKLITLSTSKNEKYSEKYLNWMSLICHSEEEKSSMAYLLSMEDNYMISHDIQNPGTLGAKYLQAMPGADGEKYFNSKCGILSRTVKYSKELMNYFEAKRNKQIIPQLNFSKILEWIMHEKEEKINHKRVAAAYFFSKCLGINFLCQLSSEYILILLKDDNPNLEFVIDIIDLSHEFEDERIFKNVENVFRENIDLILNTEKWDNFKSARFILEKIQNCPKKTLNVLSINTFLLSLPHNFVLEETGTIFTSKEFEFSLFHQKIQFKIQILESSDIKISCIQNSESSYDYGCVFGITFKIIGMEENTIYKEFFLCQRCVSVIYSKDHFIKKYAEGYDSNIWQVKIVIKMIEHENLPNGHREKHQQWFQELMSKVCKSDEEKKDLAFLLKRPSLSDVFTGRNDVMFVVVKSAYISKTKKYSRELVEYLEARSIKDASIPKLDFSKILNWILRGKDGPIEPQDAIVAFKQSCRLGLNYLQIISSEYIIELLRGNPDLDFVVDVIVAADLLEDPLLFSNALIRFLPNFLAIKASEKWKLYRETPGNLSHSIIHGLEYRLKSGVVYSPPSIDEKV